MRHVGLAILLTCGVMTVLMLPACATSPSDSSDSASSSRSRKVLVAYDGRFAGQTASGNLSLLVDIAIENQGYEAFNTSPADFSVRVDQYLYQAKDSRLPSVDLQSGSKISGTLTFEVPPVAATSRVGYALAHSASGRYAIEWFRQPGLSASQANATAISPTVTITHSEYYMLDRPTGKLYVMADLAIDNRGYESFNTSPKYFALVVGNIFGQAQERTEYTFDGALSDRRDGAYSDLRAYDLQNGGKLTGTLAFLVPPDVLAATRSHELAYSGLRPYAIEWVRVFPRQ